MKTTYLTTIAVSFNPFSPSSRVPRFFLQSLPTKAHKDIKITHAVLPRTSTAPATMQLGFKDGKSMNFSWTEHVKGREKPKNVGLPYIVEEVERHARILGRKEELAG